MSSLFRPRPSHFCTVYTASLPTKAGIFLQQYVMDGDSMDEPPSYGSFENSISLPKTVSTLALEQVDSFFQEHPLPPTTNYFVRSDRPPSAWKLLSGPALSNAGTDVNTEPSRKRRYRVLYPPGYEDVFLHKSVWTSNTDSLPRYFVELHGRNRYEPEPIAIMGRCDLDEHEEDEVKDIALSHVSRVCSRIEDGITKTTRYATFCEMEYFSWDWRCKTEGARQDMRHLIDKGKEKCAVSDGLVLQLERFLEFVDKQGIYPEVIRILRKNVAGASVRLERLRL